MAKLCIVTSLVRNCCYRHYSVWANGKVYHFNERGAHCETEKMFMAQRRLLREIEATKTNAEVEAYYQAHINNQYNPISFNCEHFAYECATGQKKSPTVKGYMIGAIVLKIIILAVCFIRKKQ